MFLIKTSYSAGCCEKNVLDMILVVIKLYIEKWLKNGGNVSGVAVFMFNDFVFNLIKTFGLFYIF